MELSGTCSKSRGPHPNALPTGVFQAELPARGVFFLAAGSCTRLVWGLCSPRREAASGTGLACRGLLAACSLPRASRDDFCVFLSSGPRDLPQPESLRRELQGAHVRLAVGERGGARGGLLLGGAGYGEQSKVPNTRLTLPPGSRVSSELHWRWEEGYREVFITFRPGWPQPQQRCPSPVTCFRPETLPEDALPLFVVPAARSFPQQQEIREGSRISPHNRIC